MMLFALYECFAKVTSVVFAVKIYIAVFWNESNVKSIEKRECIA